MFCFLPPTMMNSEVAGEDSQPQDGTQEKDTDGHPSLQNEKRKKKKKKHMQTDGKPFILVLPLLHTHICIDLVLRV